MSLHHLGIAHFPVLHRQFTSPTSRSFRESSPNEDLTQDSKDVLIERLNDLVLRLSKSTSLEDSAVTAIHSEVDRIELLIKGEERQQISRHGSDMSEYPKSPREEETFWGPPTPAQNMKMHLPGIGRNPPRGENSSGDMVTPEKVIEIAKAAEEIADKLTTTVQELLIRKEESDHIHDLLVNRAEKAAERILCLEYRIAEMEDDFQANQSELKFLRIQLQAIEVQSSQYLPRHEDPELKESIQNWKIDWEDIDRRSKARRQKCQFPPNQRGPSYGIVDT